MLTTKLVSGKDQLAQIAQLSAANQVANISAETKEKEGFVTWIYPLEVLETLHAIVPSVIALDGDKVIGYAITLTKECVPAYPPLAGTVDYVSTLTYKDRPLIDYPIYFMGQICVHEDYRGRGVVKMLYDFHRYQFSSTYTMLITEISTRNPRSLRAHQKAGFKIINTHRDEDDEWDLVVWDWA